MDSGKPHRYSNDFVEFDYDSSTFAFNVVASVLLSPLRILYRVVKTVPSLPVSGMKIYSKVLFGVSCVYFMVGVYLRITADKPYLLLASILGLVYSVYLFAKLAKFIAPVTKKREVVIDKSQVEEICNNLVDELERM